MKIEEYLRNQIKTYFLDLVRKDKCEECGSTEDLQVHHVKQFIDIVYDALEILNIKYKDNKEDYSKLELLQIKNMVLGMHLTNEYLTLCGTCHKEIHKIFGSKRKKSHKRCIHEFTMKEFCETNPLIGYLEEPPTYDVICIKEHNGINIGERGIMEVGICTMNSDDATFDISWDDKGEFNYLQKTDENVLYKILSISFFY